MCGISVSVLRGESDCTNEGVTSPVHGRRRFFLVGEGVPSVEKPREGDVVLRLVRRSIRGAEYLHAEPVDLPKGRHAMAGGNFVFSTDSRFRRAVCAYPISVHDRVER